MPRPKSEIPWLDRRDNGKFYVNWYDAGARRTQRLSLRTEDLAEAKARFAAFLSEGGDIVRGAPGLRLSVTSAVDQYLKEHADVKCAAADRQRFAAVHLKAFFGETPMADVDIPLSRSYANYRGAAPATVKRELGVLLAAANHAVKWRRMPAEQVPRVEYPDVPKTEVAFFTPEELRQIIASATGRLRAFIVVAYFTAARRKSIETLEMRQVNVRDRLAYLHKAGHRETSKRRATVPLNKPCLDELGFLIALADDRQHHVFGRMERVKGQWKEIVPSMYRPFRKHCEALGFHGRSHPHLLRHSRATHLLQSGQSIWAVANLLGDTVKTVEDRYGHHSPRHAASAVSQWDDDMASGLS